MTVSVVPDGREPERHVALALIHVVRHAAQPDESDLGDAAGLGEVMVKFALMPMAAGALEMTGRGATLPLPSLS